MISNERKREEVEERERKERESEDFFLFLFFFQNILIEQSELFRVSARLSLGCSCNVHLLQGSVKVCGASDEKCESNSAGKTVYGFFIRYDPILW